ncbi:MAG: elongation factor G [Candidatus Sumerlaeia bacterium]
MKEYPTSQLRNVCLAGHTSSGKTSLAEAIVHQLGYTDRLGRVDDGNTVSDYDPEEVRRKVSINTSLIPVEYDGIKINVLDAPGYRDFVAEIKNAIRVSEVVLIVVDANAGVEVGTEFVFEYAQEYGKPVAFFVNKLDKEHASLDKALKDIQDTLGIEVCPLTLPVGKEAAFNSVVNLITMKQVIEAPGKKPEFKDIPADLAEQARQMQGKIIELAAEGDDELTMKFLEGQELSDEEVLQGLSECLRDRRLSPVFCGSAVKCLGVFPLLRCIKALFPPPDKLTPYKAVKSDGGEEFDLPVDPDGPACAFVFKTVSDPYAGRLNFLKVIRGAVSAESIVLNVNKNKEERISHLLTVRGKKSEDIGRAHAGDIAAVAKFSVTLTNDTLCDPSNPIKILPTVLPPHTCFAALSAESKAEEEKIGLGMHRLIEQDPSLHMYRDSEIRQTILAGLGDTHLDVAVNRLEQQTGIKAELTTPRVPYRETITRKGDGMYRHKKQSGGRGQFGEVWLKLEPLPRSAGFEFEWAIVGGAIPTKFQPSVEKGILEAMERGIIAGYRAVDIKAICYDGKYHSVDSSDMAFKIAGRMAFRKVAQECGPIILEPIYRVKVTVPEEFLGDIMGDISGKRGRIVGNNQDGRKVVVEADVPLAEMFEYSRQLRSMTHGRGSFEMVFSHYEPVPSNIQQQIVEKAEKIKDEEE